MLPVREHIDFEYLCELGLAASERMDKDRLYIGNLALMVETHYGDKTLADYARRINVRQSTIYDYRMVARFFRDFPPCGKFLNKEIYPTLNFSLFRSAARIANNESLPAAIRFLETCAANAYTIEEAEYHTSTDKDAYKPEKIAEFESEISFYDDFFDDPLFWIPEGLKLHPGRTYLITLYEVKQPQETK